MNAQCIFCHMPQERIYAESDVSYSVKDLYPVTTGHMLFIPKRHVSSGLELTPNEIFDLYAEAQIASVSLMAEDPTITGFNVGFNVGTSAGQTVMHAHLHLIPRRDGDNPNPIGGIRNVIPGKGQYK